MTSLFSIVRYDIQRLASNWYGATIASVGQTFIQSLQEPQ